MPPGLPRGIHARFSRGRSRLLVAADCFRLGNPARGPLRIRCRADAAFLHTHLVRADLQAGGNCRICDITQFFFGRTFFYEIYALETPDFHFYGDLV